MSSTRTERDASTCVFFPGATTRVGSDCLLMAYSHVAHDCHVGDRVVIANAVQMAGFVTFPSASNRGASNRMS